MRCLEEDRQQLLRERAALQAERLSFEQMQSRVEEVNAMKKHKVRLNIGGSYFEPGPGTTPCQCHEAPCASTANSAAVSQRTSNVANSLPPVSHAPSTRPRNLFVVGVAGPAGKPRGLHAVPNVGGGLGTMIHEPQP